MDSITQTNALIYGIIFQSWTNAIRVHVSITKPTNPFQRLIKRQVSINYTKMKYHTLASISPIAVQLPPTSSNI